MEISLNNQTLLLNDGFTIKKLLDHINMQHKYFAVEVNEQIIPKSNHELFVIKEGDKVEIVTAIGGG